MRFYEFEAKQLLAKQGVPTPKGGVAATPEEAERVASEVGGATVLKSQVLSGGRMNAGGVGGEFGDVVRSVRVLTTSSYDAPLGRIRLRRDQFTLLRSRTSLLNEDSAKAVRYSLSRSVAARIP